MESKSIRTYKNKSKSKLNKIGSERRFQDGVIDNVCRLCLGTKNLSKMFCVQEQIDKFVEVLASTTGLQIHPNDGLPQHICSECGNLVKESHRLRKQSQNSYLSLQKVLKGLTKIEHANNDEVEIFDKVKIEDTGDYVEEIEIATTEYIKNEIETSEDNNATVKTVNRNIKTLKDEIKDNSNKTENVMNVTSENSKEVEKKKHKRTKKELRELYLSYVEGDFDPEAPVQGPIRCNQCSNVAVSKWPCFQSHVRKKHGLVNKVVCESCGKMFFGNYDLDRHRRSYHGLEWTFACKYCDHKAISKLRLENHERRTHTGDRPYLCDKCDAAYYNRRCLLQHLDSHLASAEVQCDLCPAKLKSRAHLSRHKYTVHSDKRRIRRREQRAAAKLAKLQRLDRVQSPQTVNLGQEE